jgi:hypothetical protein
MKRLVGTTIDDMPLLQFIHVTAAYSNAVLVAIMPHVNDFAEKAELNIPLPITCGQVERFNVSNIQGYIGGGLWLTNNALFSFDCGGVSTFYFTTNNPWLSEDPAKDWPLYLGKDNMTTNDAINKARETLVKLGYDPKELLADKPPTSIEGPYDLREGHFPYCQIKWHQEPQSPEDTNEDISVKFQFNMTTKSIIGITAISRKLIKPNPKIDVVPETEKEYQERIHPKMFINTNAPKALDVKPTQ